MKEIKLHYTEALLRQVVRDSYFNQLKGLRAWLAPILVLSWACFLLMPFFLAKHDWILVALTTAVTFKVVSYIRNYREAMRRSVESLRDGRYEGWTISLMEEHLATSAANWSSTILWKAFSKIERHPTYWCLFGRYSNQVFLPLDCLDAEDREFISRKIPAAKQA